MGVSDADRTLLDRQDRLSDIGSVADSDIEPVIVTLVMIGLNFDTADQARAAQVDRLERLIQAYEREDRTFGMVIFGDLNNRLVCWEDLAPSVMTVNEESKKVPYLSPNGADTLCRMIEDPRGRRDLFEKKDSWFFEGKDALGKDLSPPAACVKLRSLFNLHIDVADRDNLPLPT